MTKASARYCTPEEVETARRQIAAIGAARKFQVLHVDPPWTFKRRGKATEGDRNPDKHYPTMKIADIRSLPVGDLADKDCWLFMWTSGPWLKQALTVFDAWGFEYSTRVFTWCKLKPSQADQTYFTEQDFPPGLGYTSRAQTEIVLLGRRGRPQRVSKSVPELIFAPRREHSRKPDEIRKRIERLAGDVPRIELFARQAAPGWERWGNEVSKFDPEPAVGACPDCTDRLPSGAFFCQRMMTYQDSGEPRLCDPSTSRPMTTA